jgi:hypothetical protein
VSANHVEMRDDDEPRLVHLVGLDRKPDGLLGYPQARPVIVREIVVEPDGRRYIREVEFPRGL